MASLFGRMTGVGTPAYRWFDLITSLRSSAILLVLFLDDFVCVMRCTVMTLFVGLCSLCLLRVDKRVYEKGRFKTKSVYRSQGHGLFYFF